MTLAVTFNNTSLPLYGTTGQTWGFGDGATSTFTNPTHVYTTPGVYTVTLTTAMVTETHTVTRTSCVTVTPGGTPALIAGLVATNDSPTELGQATTLTATVSTGTNVSYAWAFGDGTTGSGATVTHTYASADTYTAVVTAPNSVNTVTATTTVTITGSGPVTVTRSITYTYDNLHRLTGATYRSTSLTAGPTGESYAYQGCRSGSDDAVGNRVAYPDTTGTTTYAYDAANRLESIELPDSSVQTYIWDARGNLLSTGAFTYTYDAAGRMVRAESVDLTSVYTYTVDGLRVQQDADGAVTPFAWDWALPDTVGRVPELLSDGLAVGGQPTALYLVGHDTLGWADAGGWTYAVPDALGSVRQAVDDAELLLVAIGQVADAPAQIEFHGLGKLVDATRVIAGEEAG